MLNVLRASSPVVKKTRGEEGQPVCMCEPESSGCSVPALWSRAATAVGDSTASQERSGALQL